MANKPGYDGGIKSMRTGFSIIEYLRDEQGARLSEIASGVGIADSTAHAYLATFQELDLVIKEDGQFRLSLKPLDIGMRAREHYGRLLKTAEPVVDQLVAETEETANIVVEERNKAAYVYRESGERGIPTNSWVGIQKPIHTLSAGKAILSALPTERVDEIVAAEGLPAVTEQTITSPEALHEELETVRERGYAINDRESHHGIRAVGVPIVTDEGVIGAVSIAGPANRLTGGYLHDELPDLILGAVNEIELKLAHDL